MFSCRIFKDTEKNILTSSSLFHGIRGNILLFSDHGLPFSTSEKRSKKSIFFTFCYTHTRAHFLPNYTCTYVKNGE